MTGVGAVSGRGRRRPAVGVGVGARSGRGVGVAVGRAVGGVGVGRCRGRAGVGAGRGRRRGRRGRRRRGGRHLGRGWLGVGSSAAAAAPGIEPRIDSPRPAARSRRRARRWDFPSCVHRPSLPRPTPERSRSMVPPPRHDGPAARCGSAPRRPPRRRTACPQKLGGVRQKSTVAASSPWLAFQCGSRDGNVIASPSCRT